MTNQTQVSMPHWTPQHVGVLLLAAADAALCGAMLTGRMAVGGGLTLHVLLVTAGVIQMRDRIDGDRALSTIGVLVTLIAGPLGLLCFAILIVIDRRSAIAPGALDDWYRRISGVPDTDPARLLYDTFATGRALKFGEMQSRSFHEIIRAGTMGEKQALLGLIGLKFHQSYFPVLQVALRSPEGSVRAQAAAVFVKLKLEVRRRLLALLEDRTGVSSIDRATAILNCTNSRFLDADEAGRAREVALALCRRTVEHDPDDDRAFTVFCQVLSANDEHDAVVAQVAARTGPHPVEITELLKGSLMALRRHQELREQLLRMVPQRRPTELVPSGV